MSAVMRQDVGKGFRVGKPHLVVKLKGGWLFDSDRRRFVSADGRQFSPVKDLPKRTRIVYMTPMLARKSLKSLSKEEKELVRYVQVILPKGQDPSAYLVRVREWECVADVNLPPDLSLPD